MLNFQSGDYSNSVTGRFYTWKRFAYSSSRRIQTFHSCIWMQNSGKLRRGSAQWTIATRSKSSRSWLCAPTTCGKRFSKIDHLSCTLADMVNSRRNWPCMTLKAKANDMNDRFRPPLVVIVVGRQNSTDWSLTTDGKVEWSFLDDLFRCLSYDIGSPHAGNPAIPVYFSIGDFNSSGKASLPPLIKVSLTQRTVVLVLLDSGFRKATSKWTEFFNEMRKHSQSSNNQLMFIPMARTDDGQLGMDIRRLGLGAVAPIYLRTGDDRYRESKDARRFFRISAMIVAIQAICRNPESRQLLDVSIFISYAKRDGEDIANRLRQAFDEYPGICALVDSRVVTPGDSVDGNSLEQKLAASTCVVVCQTATYADRLWCQREALLAKRSDVPLIVVDLRDGLERRGCDSLTNCPRLKFSGAIDSHVGDIVELAVSEILRIAHHRSRSVALLAPAGIDSQRVEVLVRAPELVRLIDLVATNTEAVREGRRPRDLLLHPDPPLREHELNMLRMVDPSFQFRTPSNVLIDSVTREEESCPPQPRPSRPIK